MKHLFSLCTCLFLSFPIFAQSEWFIPFGQTENEVKSFLQDKDYLQNVKEEPELNRLLASVEDRKRVEYVFERGKLYATSVTRNYEDKKIMREIKNNCLEYMELVSKNQVEETMVGDAVCFTALADKRVIKLFVIPTASRHQHILQLTSYALGSNMPGITPDLHYENTMLKKKNKNKSEVLVTDARN